MRINPNFTILYTVPHLVSVVCGCRDKLADDCSCRCLSQQKEDLAWCSERFMAQLSVSSPCCGQTGWALVWPVLSLLIFHIVADCLSVYASISTFFTVEYPRWLLTSSDQAECQRVNIMTPTDVLRLFFAPYRAVGSYILPQLHFNAAVVMNDVNTKLCWWHACVSKELLKP